MRKYILISVGVFIVFFIFIYLLQISFIKRELQGRLRQSKNSTLALSLEADRKQYKVGDKIVLTVFLKNNGNTDIKVNELDLAQNSIIFSGSWKGKPNLNLNSRKMLRKVVLRPQEILEKKFTFKIDNNWLSWSPLRIGCAYHVDDGWISSQEDVEITVYK